MCLVRIENNHSATVKEPTTARVTRRASGYCFYESCYTEVLAMA